ncbi:helix-turn-helix domain-containing protein [Candidatus Pacearchaeota archaeon]|nr:helix-turn-helix domain-containing protein [Candidatus Pacearchaeota archaeon]
MSGSEKERLVLLTLKLEIPNYWENSFVKKFSNASFVIQNGNIYGDSSFFGLLKFSGVNSSLIKRFLSNKFPHVEFEDFYPQGDFYSYVDSDSILAEIFRQNLCIFIWPAEMHGEYKLVKLLLKRKNVGPLLDRIEDNGIKISTFSISNMAFSPQDILTIKQRQVFLPSLKMGYYDFPKRITLNNLAKKLEISPSTLCVHLQKIENKLLGSNYFDLLVNQ